MYIWYTVAMRYLLVGEVVVGAALAQRVDLVQRDGEGPGVGGRGVVAGQRRLPRAPAQRHHARAHLPVVARVRLVVRAEVADLHLVAFADQDVPANKQYNIEVLIKQTKQYCKLQ